MLAGGEEGEKTRVVIEMHIVQHQHSHETAAGRASGAGDGLRRRNGPEADRADHSVRGPPRI